MLDQGQIMRACVRRAMRIPGSSRDGSMEPLLRVEEIQIIRTANLIRQSEVDRTWQRVKTRMSI